MDKLDKPTYRGVVRFLGWVENRRWMRNIYHGIKWYELTSDWVVRGIDPVDNAYYVRRKSEGH